MTPTDRPANAYSFPSSGRRIELDFIDAARKLGGRLRSGAQMLVAATARQTCRQPLVVFGVATVIGAILTRSAWQPKAES